MTDRPAASEDRGPIGGPANGDASGSASGQANGQTSGQVIRFRRRGSAANAWRWPSPQPAEPPDLSRFERAKGEDDYRHRMTMNALALLVTLVLGTVGLWLAVSIADMRRNQDCYLQGGRNCNQLSVPPAER